jgi:hypothetical protein
MNWIARVAHKKMPFIRANIEAGDGFKPNARCLVLFEDPDTRAPQIVATPFGSEVALALADPEAKTLTFNIFAYVSEMKEMFAKLDNIDTWLAAQEEAKGA